MSFPILPALPFTITKSGFKKMPHYASVVQKTAAMMGNSSISLSPYPTYDFEVDLNYIEGTESDASSVLASFLGTYMQCNGQASLFLFTDPTDSSVTAMPFGTGDGSSTAFQLTRSIGGVGIDVIQSVNGSPSIFVNGVLKTDGTDYSVGNTGIVTFVSAPALNATLSWTGNFYKLCRFADDTIAGLAVVAFNTAGTEFWVADSIKFSTEFIQPASAGAVVAGVLWENFDGGTF